MTAATVQSDPLPDPTFDISGTREHSLNPAARTARCIVLSGRIGPFSFGECFLCGTSIREHANQAVVALVTSAFVDLILLLAVLLQLLNGCPRFCPRYRVFQRDLERERI